MTAVVAAFNQEKALVGAFSVIVQPVVEPMDRFAALVASDHQTGASVCWEVESCQVFIVECGHFNQG